MSREVVKEVIWEDNDEKTPRASLYADHVVKVEHISCDPLEISTHQEDFDSNADSEVHFEVEVGTEEPQSPDMETSSQGMVDISRIRSTFGQFACLVEFMERHGDLARQYPGLQGRLRAERLWQELTTAMNSVPGGVGKPQERWKKVWADWKTKTKKKAIAIKHLEATGQKLGNRHLNALEKRVIAIMGMYTNPDNYWNGQPVEEDQGVSIPSQSTSPATQSPSQLEPTATPLEQHLTVEVPSIPTPTVPPPAPPEPQASSPTPAAYRRQQQSRARRRKAYAPFESVADTLLAIEQRRFKLEENRVQNQHERDNEAMRIEGMRVQLERERLQVERERVQVERERVQVERERVLAARENNSVLDRVREVAQAWLDYCRNRE